jgi:hypothetical protein
VGIKSLHCCISRLHLHRHGADAAKLAMLLKYCAIPRIGRFKTFGHEYAFARPPEWWHAPSVGALTLVTHS